jgi:hypothetical protein
MRKQNGHSRNVIRAELVLIAALLILLCCCPWRKLHSSFSDSIVISDDREVWTVDISPDGCRLGVRLYENNFFLAQPCYAPVLKKILVPIKKASYQVSQPLRPLELSGSVQNVILRLRGDDMTWPSVSPNGRYIAFILPDENLTRKLVIIDSEGDSLLYIGDEKSRLGGRQYPYGHRPAWLPDSSGVICEVAQDKEYLVLFRFLEGGSMSMTRIGEGFAPAISSNGTLAFYLREGQVIKVCTGTLNSNSLTIENVKVRYKSKRIMDHISPAWSRQNQGFLFFLEDWIWALYEAQRLCLLDTSSGITFYPDKKGTLKYRMYFGFDALPKEYISKPNGSD